MKIVIIFGEMGAGKTFVGKQIAEKFKQPYFEGDDFLPDDLKEKVDKGSPLTVSDVDRFVISHLIPGIISLSQSKGDLVLSQALYRKEHRTLIETMLKQEQIEVKFYWIRPKSIWLQSKALLKRTNGIRWLLIMLISKPWFQKPKMNVNVNVILNSYDGSLI